MIHDADIFNTNPSKEREEKRKLKSKLFALMTR